MPIHQNTKLSNSTLLRQLPGICMYMDAQNHLRYCNDRAAFILGFDHANKTRGVHISDIPCKAAECTDIFTMQNKLVIEEHVPLTILDIHPYRNDNTITMLTKKTPYYDSTNKVAGVLMSSTEITHNTLFNVAMIFAHTDTRYKQNNKLKQRSYMISKKFKKNDLTPRELECLFYFVRGMTATKIANVLHISKRTVETHLSHIKTKLGCINKSDLIEYAIDSCFIDFIPESAFSKLNISVII